MTEHVTKKQVTSAKLQYALFISLHFVFLLMVCGLAFVIIKSGDLGGPLFQLLLFLACAYGMYRQSSSEYDRWQILRQQYALQNKTVEELTPNDFNN